MKSISSLVVFCISFSFCFGCGHRYPNNKELNLWEHECQPIIDFACLNLIETGKYPLELPDEFIKRLNSFRVPARYNNYSRTDHEYFNLVIGDYSKSGWCYIYCRELGWYMDR